MYWGSSPHTRGALAELQVVEHRVGIIPAYAGSTGRRRMALRITAGSSPHARGALLVGPDEVRDAGIIPACAGSTDRYRGRSRAGRDHPRMRGEHVCTAIRGSWIPGSSPHARGALWAHGYGTKHAGIIPACAGSTASPRLVAWLTGGSSPHARGAPAQEARDVRWKGIIPACAGSTSCTSRILRLARDHPRMRGEHSPFSPFSPSRPGSSPHARGAQSVAHRPSTKPRIIPACAGSTRTRRPSRRKSRDHPRMRGEHSASQTKSSTKSGSSPHARGARWSRHATSAPKGIIPACAGSTAR